MPKQYLDTGSPSEVFTNHYNNMLIIYSNRSYFSQHHIKIESILL